jgi:hypothetical protein
VAITALPIAGRLRRRNRVACDVTAVRDVADSPGIAIFADIAAFAGLDLMIS